MNNSFVRKIDDLGRVVIPKEVRNKLNIQDNESIIISCNEKNIQISKFSYFDKYNSYVVSLCNLFKDTFDIEVELFDRDNLIISTNKSKYICFYENDLFKDSIKIGYIKFYGKEVCLDIAKFLIKLIDLYFNYS